MKGTSGKFFENQVNVAAVLLLPALLVYAKSLQFGFTTMDEQWMIVKDTAFLGNWENAKASFFVRSTDFYYRPLFMISLIVDYHIGKLSPYFYHLSNLVWFLLSVFLLYRLLVLSEVQKKTAFYFSLLFSLHPVLLHAVAWVPGRNDIMLSVFVLSSLIFFKKYLATSGTKDFLLSLFFFICALFTKESAIVLPLIFVAFYFTFRKFEWKKLLMLGFVWSVISIAWLILRNSVAGQGITSTNNTSTNILNSLLGFILFVGKTLYPFQQSVLPTVAQASLWPGILTIAALVILCFKPGLKNKKIAFLGLFIFFILLIIPIWFGASKISSEHYEQRLYGSMAGLVLFFTQIKFNVESKTWLICFYLLAGSYVLKTITRMNIYKSEMNFAEAGMKECPDYYLFYLQKADLLNLDYKYAESLPYYNKCLALRPNYPHALSNRGSAHFDLDMFKEAIDDYTNAIEHSSFNQSYYLNRCIAYLRVKDIENSMKDLMILRKCCPEIIREEVKKEIADLWFLHLETLRKQLENDKKNAGRYFKIATLYFDIDLKEHGLNYLKQAIQLEPGNETYRNLLLKHSSKD